MMISRRKKLEERRKQKSEKGGARRGEGSEGGGGGRERQGRGSGAEMGVLQKAERTEGEGREEAVWRDGGGDHWLLWVSLGLVVRRQMRRGVTDAVERVQRSLHNASYSCSSIILVALRTLIERVWWGGGKATQGAEEGFSKGLRLTPGGTNALPKSMWPLIFKLHTATFLTDLPGNAPTAHRSHPLHNWPCSF